MIEVPANPTHLHLASVTKVRAVRVTERFESLALNDGTGKLHHREFIEVGDWIIGSDDECEPCERLPAIVPGIVFEKCYQEL